MHTCIKSLLVPHKYVQLFCFFIYQLKRSSNPERNIDLSEKNPLFISKSMTEFAIQRKAIFAGRIKEILVLSRHDVIVI
jgi:hypothetical protein